MLGGTIRRFAGTLFQDRVLRRLPPDLLASYREEVTRRASQNPPFLRVMLAGVKAAFRVVSLPVIREFHPWVSEKHNHGVFLPINQELVFDNVPMPYPIIEAFIEKSAYRMIMNVCGCRQAYECPNHSPKLGCLNMGESVLEMPPGLGRLVSKDEARAHVRKAIDDGLVPSVGKGRIDNFLYQVPDRGKMLGVCFCCHCCCITGFFNHLPAEKVNRMFPRLQEITLAVGEGCTGCGACLDYCLYNAIAIVNGRAAQNDYCRQCGRCASQCPSRAIRISLSSMDFQDDLVRRISVYADVT